MNHIFRAVGAVPFSIPYADFKVIASGIQYYQEGGDPYRSREFDYRGRFYNYLPFWLHMPFLGLEQEDIKYVYLAFASLFAMGVALVFWMNSQYGETVLVLNELANWSIFFVLVALQFKLLPQFVRDTVYR